MKSTSRIFLNCMFCGKEGTTKEHIFGKRISQSFEPRAYGVKRFRHNMPAEALTKDEVRKFWRRGGDHLLAVTSSSMCGDCNNLLGKELTPLSALIAAIYKGQTNIIPAKHAHPFFRYFQRIGILVDLETAAFDPTVMRQSEDDTNFNRNYHVCPPMLSPEQRSMFLAGDLVQNIEVYIGRHHGTYGKGYLMNVPFARDGDRKVQIFKTIIFSIEKFTCLISIGSAPNENPKLQRIEPTNSDIRINRELISTDADIKLNYAPFDVYPNDLEVPKVVFFPIQQA